MKAGKSQETGGYYAARRVFSVLLTWQYWKNRKIKFQFETDRYGLFLAQVACVAYQFFDSIDSLVCIIKRQIFQKWLANFHLRNARGREKK